MEEERLPFVSLGNRYAFLDPAGGKAQRDQLRKGLARSAIVVVASDSIGRIIVLEAWCKRAATQDLITEIFRVNSEYKPVKFGIEANGLAGLFADSVNHIARMEQVQVPIVSVMQNTRVDKLFRIRTALQPLFGEGRLIIGQDQQELRNELKAFPRGQTVDLVDSLASVVVMVPELPIEQEVKNEAEDLAKYLREQGVAPGYITQRIGRFYGEHGLSNPYSAPPRRPAHKGRVLNFPQRVES